MDGSINGKGSLRFVKSNNSISFKKYIIYYLTLIFTSFLCFKSFNEVNLKDIYIYGTNFISQEEIIKNSSLILPKKLILIKTKFHEKELKENLSLKNISIKRQLFPFGLNLFLETREPVASAEFIKNDATIRGFVDAEGFFIYKKFAILQKDLHSELRIIGWKKIYREVISKIIKAYKDDKDLEVIFISKEGFLVLEEKTFKKIYLGNQAEKIDLQLKLLFELKEQLKDKDLFEKIENLDLTDINNPIIKVFKP